jgi:hypothetical protein
MPRARPRAALDVSRLSSLVQRPGIDPRINLTFAVVTELGFDATHGPFADVVFQPTGENETCLIGAAYAGGGFGMWGPLRVDDTVLVAVPNGDPNSGPVIIARIWDAADSPSADFKNPVQDNGADVPSDDFVLRVRDGQKFTLRLSGSGAIDIKVEGDGETTIENAGAGAITIKQTGSGDVNITCPGGNHVNLGDAPGAHPIALGDQIQGYLNALKFYIDNTLTLPVSGSTAGPTAAPPSPNVPTVTAQKGAVT